MNMFKKSLTKLVAAAICAGCIVSSANVTVSYAEEVNTPVASETAEVAALTNLALNKPVTFNAEHSSFKGSYAVDGNENTRWSTEQKAPAWLQVDLGSVCDISEFRIMSENNAAQKIGKFKIEGSETGAEGSWKVLHQSEDKTNGGFPLDHKVTLQTPAKARYVKLTIETQASGAYPSVSLREFQVMGTTAATQPETSPTPTTAPEQEVSENLALRKTAVASSQEADSVRAANATDGNTKDRNSRWGSNVGAAPHWIYVDLGSEQNVQSFRIFWETRKATNYKIQIAGADAKNLDQDAAWKDVQAFTQRPDALKQLVVLDQPQKARYVRLLVNAFDAKDPDSDGNWNSISIYELEVYNGKFVEETEPEIGVVVPETIESGTTKLQLTLPKVKGYTAAYNGTDYEQIVDTNLTLYQPLVDTDVVVSVKLTSKTNPNDYEFMEKTVTIPGKFKAAQGDNPAPAVMPELREWKGATGTFTPTETSRIVIKDKALLDVANAFKADYKDITGRDITVVEAAEANAGDFFLALTTDKSLGLKEEGYLMEVTDKVSVTAEDARGAFWSTRTILQSLKSTQNIACGTARDYPLYSVRGFILDVGRKTFTMDWLRECVKQMSWYKMNDFQVHLNDNLIPLEYYTNNGLDVFDAYSAFRLESDIKEGGNGGKNKADLTAKDVFYTKDEFRDFIKESRVYGVDIVPEIDVPAHSLALTKVRPDLRHGTNGRQNDHLALATKYDECIQFVKGIFNEYMGKDLKNPVFDKDTIVHIGADEYTANAEAYRKFADEMLGYVQDSGRTPRIWGSLSSIKGNTNVRAEGVQMNLWNFGWANMDKMYEQGFDLINCNDGNYYIVPNAGYYYDYLNKGTLYNLPINEIGGVHIPAGDKQMLGGAFAVWNDMTDYLENGISEYDVFDRIDDEMALFSSKLWGKHERTLDQANAEYKKLGAAPSTNFGYETTKTEDGKIAHYAMDDMKDSSGLGHDLENGKNAKIAEVDGRKALKLNGDASFVNTKDLTTVGLGNDLRVKVKRTSADNKEQVLFESAYGSIKAVQKGTGNVGFTRENHDYSFNYTLPVNEWVELEFKNEQNKTYLYVNGELRDVLGDGERVESRPLLATEMFPIDKIGSAKNAFIGYVDDVRLGTKADFNSTMALDHAVVTASKVAGENADLAAMLKEAEGIFKQYAPEKAAIDALTARIQEVINNTEFAKADYSRVDAYLEQIPADLSHFTEQSVARLNYVKSQIRRDLPKSMQSTVDGYEKSLREAINGLEVINSNNVNYVDVTHAKASSAQDNGSAAEKAIDGNLDTMWHSKWSITTMPHWIELIMDKPTAINGLTYVPRKSGPNGVATKYEILVSNTGEEGTYTKIKEGTLKNNNQAKEITFDRVETKHVRFVILEAPNNNGSAAEIKLHAADVAPNMDGLNAAIADAKSVKNTDNKYTPETWKALQDVIKSAEELAANTSADPNEVEIMIRSLYEAKSNLVLADNTKPEPTPTTEPTAKPTVKPTVEPTVEPTAKPTAKPTVKPTVEPTAKPTAPSTAEPSTKPTAPSTGEPTTKPTDEPAKDAVIVTYTIGKKSVKVPVEDASNTTMKEVLKDAVKLEANQVFKGWFTEPNGKGKKIDLEKPVSAYVNTKVRAIQGEVKVYAYIVDAATGNPSNDKRPATGDARSAMPWAFVLAGALAAGFVIKKH